jgi:hypothetical protein
VEELYLEPADPNLEAELDEFDAEEAHFVEFGRDKRLPCFAHSLVCALKASIEKSPIYNTILNLATAVVTAFTQSALKSGLLFNLTGKRLIRPVRTRWLFAYYMLDRLLELRTHVDFIIENELLDVGLTPNQWRQAELLCMFLKDFANQVTELEGEKYVTLNRIIPALMDLLEHCKEFEQQQGFTQIARVVANEMRRRFTYILDPSSEKFQPIYAVATMLDPSVRPLLSLKDYSSLLDAAKSDAIRIMRQANSSVGMDNQSLVESEPSPSSTASSNKYQRLFRQLATQEEQHTNSRSAISSVDNELRSYLLMEQRKVSDPVQFWMSQEQAMPQMSQLALDVFSVTATSAPIERVFSHAGIATHGRRNRLEADSLNAELIMKMNHFLLE